MSPTENHSGGMTALGTDRRRSGHAVLMMVVNPFPCRQQKIIPEE
jgi:hypothetical protein